MDNNHGDLLGEAERNRRTMERGSFHRSPSVGVEAMVAVVDGRRQLILISVMMAIREELLSCCYSIGSYPNIGLRLSYRDQTQDMGFAVALISGL